MSKKFIAGGCSFTFGHELSDDDQGKIPSKKSWAYLIKDQKDQYICTAKGGLGNQGIARRVFHAVQSFKPEEISCVAVMWTFISRYDWAMPRHKYLDNTRWASITPWDTSNQQIDVHNKTAGNEPFREIWQERIDQSRETGVNDFANALYRYAANEYHELYLSWKSIIWLQNILDKKGIKYFFTLADNNLFYDEFVLHRDKNDDLIQYLYKEIDFTKWASFGERMMGFNQWALLNKYDMGITHPLDKAHEDAIMLLKPKFKKIIGGKK